MQHVHFQGTGLQMVLRLQQGQQDGLGIHHGTPSTSVPFLEDAAQFMAYPQFILLPLL